MSEREASSEAKTRGFAASSATVRDWLFAGGAATLLSGIPSTLWALLSGNDVTEATRAAGAMILPDETRLVRLFLAATVVHVVVSFFWAAVLIWLLPRRHVTAYATAAALLIGVIDLRLIAPIFFPAVAALEFWPQMADHAMWGITFGAALAYRSKGANQRPRLEN